MTDTEQTAAVQVTITCAGSVVVTNDLAGSVAVTTTADEAEGAARERRQKYCPARGQYSATAAAGRRPTRLTCG